MHRFQGRAGPVSYTHLDVYKRQEIEAATLATKNGVGERARAGADYNRCGRSGLVYPRCTTNAYIWIRGIRCTTGNGIRLRPP